MTTATGSSLRSRRTGRRLAAVIDFAVGTHVRAAAILILFSLVMFLPGLFQIPPIDREESRVAQASKQMIETRDYIDVRFLNEVRSKKPVGINWLQAGVVQSARVLGMPDALTSIWLYRIPSLFGAIGAVLLTYWAALSLTTRRGAVLAALMMAGSVLLGVEARLATADAVLLSTIVAAMGALARAYMRYEPHRPMHDPELAVPAIFWTALAAGFLLQGPAILLFVGLMLLTLAIADRSLQWARALRPASGTVWFLLLVLPWFLANVFRGGGSFFASSLSHDMMLKLAGGQDAFKAPPGFYLLLFWFTFWPGAMLAALAVPAIWKARRDRGVRLLLAWLVPAWIMAELAVTKQPHDVLPLYPAVAILIAGVVERGMLSRRFLLELTPVWWVLFPLLVAGAAVALLVVFNDGLGLLAWPFAAGAVVFGLLAWRLYPSDGAEHSLLRALVASFLIAVTVYAVTMPSLTRLFPSVQLAKAVGTSNCRLPAAAAAGFQEPSLAFLAGTSIVLTEGAGAADFLAQGPCRFAFVEGRSEPGFRQRAQAIRLRYTAGQRVEGLDYVNGRTVSIAVFRSEAQP